MADGMQILLAIIFFGFLVYLAGKILLKPFRLIFKLLYNSVAGLVVLWVLNLIGGPFGLHIPVNWLTVLVVGFLGIPGLLLVIAFNFLLGP